MKAKTQLVMYLVDSRMKRLCAGIKTFEVTAPRQKIILSGLKIQLKVFRHRRPSSNHRTRFTWTSFQLRLPSLQRQSHEEGTALSHDLRTPTGLSRESHFCPHSVQTTIVTAAASIINLRMMIILTVMQRH